MTTQESKELDDLLDRVAAKLSEHFEAVQIVASVTQREGTRFFKRGNGNWFARLEMCRQFIGDSDRIDQAKEIGREITPPNDDEKWKA